MSNGVVRWVVGAFVLGLVGAVVWAAQGPRGEHRPKVLLILVDDVGTDKIRSYAQHPRVPRTPHIDALAERGVRFTRAYANPVCSPTRAALLTGRYASRTGIGKIVDSWGPGFQLRHEERTVAEVLQEAGWETSLTGKWHLASQRGGPPELDPGQQGFEWFAGSMGNFRDESPLPRFDGTRFGYFRWIKNDNGTLEPTTTYATTDTVDDAIERIRDMRGPWFLMVSLNASHAPFELPPPDLHNRKFGPGGASTTGTYDTMVEAMDQEIGRLLENVDADTHVLFFSDNGTPARGASPPTPQGPEYNKGSMMQGGVRVPLIVAGPAVREPGRVSEALVHAVDLFPTIIEMAGLPVPSDDRPVDGISLLPALADPTGAPGRERVVLERFAPNGPGPYTGWSRAITDGRYKLIEYELPRGDSGFGLHDLTRGPHDGPNLLDESGQPTDPEHRPILDQLRADLRAHLEQTGVRALSTTP